MKYKIERLIRITVRLFQDFFTTSSLKSGCCSWTLYISIISLVWMGGGDATASHACSVPSLPATYIDVTNPIYGANPDNPDDDTNSIQAAINATPVGGTVYFPAGEYLVRAGGVSVAGLVFHSNMTVFLHTDAVLKEIPGSWANNDFRWLLGLHYLDNVTITGGTIQGVRAGYGTAEVAGHNLLIWNSQNISVINVKTADAPADGIMISGEMDKSMSEDITLCGVRSDNNRRHGLSVIHAHDVLVDNSIFSNSNGSSISSGIDLEPNTFGALVGSVTGVVMNNCQVLNNNGNGIQFHGANGSVTGNTLRYSKVLGNSYRAIRMDLVAGNTVLRNLFEDNGEITPNGHAVLRLENSSVIRVEKNTIRDGDPNFPQPGVRLAGTSQGTVIIDNDICVDYVYEAVRDETTDHAFSESLTTYCERTPHLGDTLPFLMLLLGN